MSTPNIGELIGANDGESRPKRKQKRQANVEAMPVRRKRLKSSVPRITAKMPKLR
jgi:hypothetical protein